MDLQLPPRNVITKFIQRIGNAPMKLHLIHGPKSAQRIETLSGSLRRLNFRLIEPSEDVPFFSEPVVLVWTKDFALGDRISQDELDALARAGRLVSVVVEKVTLPDTLPKHPVVDLTGWRGSPRNAFFQDFRSYLEAAYQRTPPPPPRGPLLRFLQRLFAGFTIGAIVAFVFGFALNLLGLQNNLCSINFSQPGVSDFCGKYGLGDKPTQDERIAWEGRDPTSCEALRTHIETYGDTGELFDRAAAMLDARRTATDETWSAVSQRTLFSQSVSVDGEATEELAQEAALKDAVRDAEAGCRSFAESDFYRFVAFKVSPDEWDCFTSSGQHYCGFDGVRTCELEQLNRTVTEKCGPVP